MKRHARPSYLLLAAAALLLLSLPKGGCEWARSGTVAVVAALLRQVKPQTPAAAGESGAALQGQERRLRLLAEKSSTLAHLLREAFDELERLHSLLEGGEGRWRQRALDLLQSREEAIAARLLYRSAALWDTTLWIDVGEEDVSPEKLAPGSAVVVGNALVGLVDYVGKRQSRVRLLTDASLVTAVRAVRGASESYRLLPLVDEVSRSLKGGEPFLEERERGQLLALLEKLALRLRSGAVDATYLAKGELRGSGAPLRHALSPRLVGVGFNYDFADEEGLARDLRSGRPFGAPFDTPATPLLRVGDLLVTSGLDGLFPPDLEVARITTLYPLGEGDTHYHLEAVPAAGNLFDLEILYVLPPRQFDPRDFPKELA